MLPKVTDVPERYRSLNRLVESPKSNVSLEIGTKCWSRLPNIESNIL